MKRAQSPNRRWIALPAWVLIVSLLLVAAAPAGDVKVITDIKNWHNPVKSVFQKYKVELKRVELHNKTHAVFYVKFPYDPMLGNNDNYFNPLYYATLKANGFLNYAFVDLDSSERITITWNKKNGTLSEAFEKSR